jgi:carbon storage regulator
MLVITRKVGEELKVGDNIYVKIISVDKNQVKIGVDAPRDISILRMELVKEIINQNKLANQDTDEDIIHSLNSMIKGNR